MLQLPGETRWNCQVACLESFLKHRDSHEHCRLIQELHSRQHSQNHQQHTTVQKGKSPKSIKVLDKLLGTNCTPSDPWFKEKKKSFFLIIY